MKLLQMIRAFIQEIKKDNITIHASSAAFFIFLSLIPMLILICSILPYTPVREADLMRAVTDLLPTTLDAFAVDLIEEMYGKSITVISVTVIVTIWVAGKGIEALIRALNGVNEVEETRNVLHVRLVACLDTIMFLFMLVLSMVMMVFGSYLLNLVERYIPDFELIKALFQYLRYIFMWCVLTLFFITLYVWLPNKRPKAKSQVFGACFAATGWLIFSFFFQIYLQYFGGFSMYGSLTTIIVVMIWLYSLMYIFLLGAEWNSLFDSDLSHFTLLKRMIRNKRKKDTSVK